jgi:hypothetical protein
MFVCYSHPIRTTILPIVAYSVLTLHPALRTILATSLTTRTRRVGQYNCVKMVYRTSGKTSPNKVTKLVTFSIIVPLAYSEHIAYLVVNER